MQRNPTVTKTRFLDAKQTGASLLRDTHRRSNFCLLSHLQRIIHLNAKVAHGALQLGVTRKQLHCPADEYLSRQSELGQGKAALKAQSHQQLQGQKQRYLRQDFRLDFNAPARMPNTKNKMTGSKKLCIAIAQVSVKNLVQPRLFATALVTLAIAVVRVFKVGLVDAPCRWGGHCGGG
jgi:hypothetical protein